MILAAGLGERMRPLTDHTPKPLLRVGGKALIEHHIDRLAAAGFEQLVINVSHLAEQVENFCGSGERWGLAIHYSREASPLETAGGIFQALPLLGNEPFLIVNGDIWIDCPFGELRDYVLRPGEHAHLVLVDNPPQHPQGDFVLDADNWVRERGAGETGLTYAGVGIYSRDFFAGMTAGKLALRPRLDAAIDGNTLGARHYRGAWADIGTPQRLAELDNELRGSSPENAR